MAVGQWKLRCQCRTGRAQGRRPGGGKLPPTEGSRFQQRGKQGTSAPSGSFPTLQTLVWPRPGSVTIAPFTPVDRTWDSSVSVQVPRLLFHNQSHRVFPLSKETRPRTPPSHRRLLTADPPTPSLKSGSPCLYLAPTWSATLQQILI